MSTPLVEVDALSKRFRPDGPPALDDVSATIGPGGVTGLVGPDGAGKSTLIRTMAGLLRPDAGSVRVAGCDTVADAAEIHAQVGYMPQRFGLYEELSVMENLRLYAELRGLADDEREDAFARLLDFTDLTPFTGRRAGALSGGMKQKLGLACALLRTPRVLLLDEPSVGVDPISRRELWSMVRDLVAPEIAVLWSTAYLDEAEKCDAVLLMNGGRLLFEGPPDRLTRRVADRTFRIESLARGRREVLAEALRRDDVVDGVIQGSAVRLVMRGDRPPPEPDALGAGPGARVEVVAPRFEDAFVDVLGGGPGGDSALAARFARVETGDGPVIEAHGLTKRFGDFTAARDIEFEVPRGEIFGLLGPNGAGKSTTFKMMCGLLVPSAGSARVAGVDLKRAASRARARIGYMAQKFSLYGNLTVAQNLRFFASVYGLRGRARRRAIDGMIEIFALRPYLAGTAEQLPLGFKQRLALACAVMHEPDVLFLDEPTSGVDPVTRREFWTHINGMVEKGVTVMVTTHFMDEAEYCDRIAVVHRGEIISTDTPDALKTLVRGDELPDPTLEDAFIELLRRQEPGAEEAA